MNPTKQKAELIEKFVESFVDEREKQFGGNAYLTAGIKVKYFLDEALDTIASAAKQEAEINHDIDVRYETDLEKAFDKFIKKWCGNYYPHLIDSDENDGEFIRIKIRELRSIAAVAREESKMKDEL